MNDFLLQLVKVALGNANCLSNPLDGRDWDNLYEEAKRQSLVGVCFVGIQRLPKEQLPGIERLMEWMGQAERIRSRNMVLDNQTSIAWKKLDDAGLKATILKGQGIARLYDNDLVCYRSPGDIDIWVKGGFDVVNEFVQKTIPTDDFAYHRFHYNLFENTEVELHHRPTLMRNLFDNKKLQSWCDSFSFDSFEILSEGFSVPSIAFNRIFILTHIYRHFLFEGIGLRQIMDYYFVLKNQEISDVEKNKTMSLFAQFRMEQFVAAMMWVLSDCFGLDGKYLLCKPNEKEGRFILSEIIQTGNFGHGETRYEGYSTFMRMTKHGLHLLRHYPSEVIWTPVWLVYHKMWRWKKKRSLMIDFI